MKFTQTSQEDLHMTRRKEMLAQKPKEIRDLMGPNPLSFAYILTLTAVQLSLSILVADASLFMVFLLAYSIGAILNHGLWVLNHEATHNLIFQRPFFNQLAGLLCGLTIVLPATMAFRKYHLLHHKQMGEYDKDMDLPHLSEVKWVGNSRILKMIWIFLLGPIQALRPLRMAETSILTDMWIVTNATVQLAFCTILYIFWGPLPIIYMLLTTLFALGLHPLGGRWIAEHYFADERQETYSYYGPVNKFMFNIGYHFEHHDFMNIPWNNLPALKSLFPDQYASLYSHKSYLKVLTDFIWNRSQTLADRIVREKTD